MAINFPSSPSVNDTHTHNGKEWTWNGTSWVQSTNASSYTLPIATAGALGGIRVGNRLTIDSSTGVLDADVQTSTFGTSDVDAHLNQSNPTSGYILSWNGSDYAWVVQTNTTSFAALTDTPGSYTGQSGKYLKVNASANSLEFTNAPVDYGDSDVDTHLNQSNPTSGHVLSWNGSDYAWVAQSGGGGGGGSGSGGSILQLIQETGPSGQISATAGQGSNAAWIDVIDKDITITAGTSKRVKIEVNGEPKLNGFRTMRYEIRLIRTTSSVETTLYEGYQGLADSSDNYSTMNGVLYLDTPGAGTHNYKYQFRQVISWNNSAAYVEADSMVMLLTEMDLSATGATINNNAAERVITGSATAGTLNASDKLTLDSNGTMSLDGQLTVDYVNLNGSVVQLNNALGGTNLKVKGQGTGGTYHLTLDDDVNVVGDFEFEAGIKDKDGQFGTSGQVLSSTGTQVNWIDAPSTYGDSDVDTHLNQSNPTSGYVLSWNGSDYAWVAQTTDTDTNTFTGLTGTPSSYTANKWLKVNAGGTALEYTDAPSGASVTVSDNAPSGPSAGDLWWDSDNGRLKVYYTDATPDSQWVDASPLGANSSIGIGNTSIAITDTGTNGNIAFNTDGTDRWKITSGGHIIPYSNASFDIGNAEYKVRHLFLSDNSLKFVDDNNTEHALSVSNNKLHYEGKEVLANCVFTGLDNNDTVKYNGTNWVNVEFPSAFDGTLSGDLTVDTNVLKVDTAQNQVGIGTASPNSLLHLYQPTDAVYITFGQGQHNTNYWVGTYGTTAGFFIEQGSSNNNLLTADASDYVSLYGAGTKRIETTSTGVTITGDLSVTGSAGGVVDSRINVASATSNQLLSWTGAAYDWIDPPTPAAPAFQSNWRIPL